MASNDEIDNTRYLWDSGKHIATIVEIRQSKLNSLLMICQEQSGQEMFYVCEGDLNHIGVDGELDKVKMSLENELAHMGVKYRFTTENDPTFQDPSH